MGSRFVVVQYNTSSPFWHSHMHTNAHDCSMIGYLFCHPTPHRIHQAVYTNFHQKWEVLAGVVLLDRQDLENSDICDFVIIQSMLSFTVYGFSVKCAVYFYLYPMCTSIRTDLDRLILTSELPAP